MFGSFASEVGVVDLAVDSQNLEAKNNKKLRMVTIINKHVLNRQFKFQIQI